MPIFRPQDVVDEINSLYPVPDGPGALLLSESAVVSLRRILKLINQIPVELLPKEPERRLFNEAQAVIRDALQKTAAHPSEPSLLYGTLEHKWENPLSILRGMLALCPTLKAKGDSAKTAGACG